MSPRSAAATLIVACGTLGALGYMAAILGVDDLAIFVGLALVAALHSLVVWKAPAWIALQLAKPDGAGALQAARSISDRLAGPASGLSAAIVSPAETEEAR
ncbi:hypothetical protein [Chenggangzhangella methanolivorans]|uniref:Uncharacterized protein n=2 Tax=Chenggangzhangella methanolivorans TaxID=1437009 RepID=A0A9E6RAN7_9HYPH|nr:hypothetical protein [Chenggangzhangella methanolivorans]QZO01271.1 hypothetical protein K6K41_07060 [Chenggangzhangella methanolivorans]